MTIPSAFYEAASFGIICYTCFAIAGDIVLQTSYFTRAS